MNKGEANAYSLMRLRLTRINDRIERVENGLVDGMPDVSYCIEGREGWIEIKAPDEPARAATPLWGSGHPVGIDQANWFFRQHMAGGRAFLYIATRRRLLLVNGSQVAALGRTINTLPIAELERISVWRAPVPVTIPELWQDLRAQLIGG